MWSRKCSLGSLRDEHEQEGGNQRRKVDHAHAGHELPDRGEDRLGDFVEDGVQGITRVNGDPGEDDSNEDRNEKDVREDCDEQAES
jgi:hypothetical protein